MYAPTNGTPTAPRAKRWVLVLSEPQGSPTAGWLKGADLGRARTNDTFKQRPPNNPPLSPDPETCIERATQGGGSFRIVTATIPPMQD
jgi:hypothetical protein